MSERLGFHGSFMTLDAPPPKKISADPKTDGVMTSHFLFRHYTNRISRRLPTAFA